jgi:hypothetical protein
MNKIFNGYYVQTIKDPQENIQEKIIPSFILDGKEILPHRKLSNGETELSLRKL